MSNGSIQFKLNSAGVRELLQSPEMQNILLQKGEEKAAEAGDGYMADVHVGAKRAYVNIHPATKEAYIDNLERNTLEKVIRS